MTDTTPRSDTTIITPDAIVLDAALGSRRADVIGALARRIARCGRADESGLAAAALQREEKSATGLPGGIAIPHCRSAAVNTASLAFARLRPPVDFGAADGPADLVFLIAAPEDAGAQHMTLLSSLARALVRPDFVTSLRDAPTPAAIVDLVVSAIDPGQRSAPQTASVESGPAQLAGPPKEAGEEEAASIVAVTACPTGIAHTYMEADALTAAARRAGVRFHVETQGSSATDPLPPAVINGATAVIFATDVGVKGKGRFGGKPVVASGVKRAINEPDGMIAEAVNAGRSESAARVDVTEASGEGTTAPSTAPSAVGWGVRLRQILLTGVSYMIPFVAAGGMLMALGFLLGGYQIKDSAEHILLHDSLTNLPHGGLAAYLGAALYEMGNLAFKFLVPALAGYIAFAIADRPGLAPGFTAGAISVFIGAGFIGGLVGGLIGGFAALGIARVAVPRWTKGLMPVAIIPLLATFISGGLMLVVLGRPLAAVTTGLEHFLNGLTGSSAVLLGILLGIMMCFDLGGPVNKAAYAFAVAGLSVANIGSLRIMAAVMAAGMVPPLAMALASLVRPKLFSADERENGKAAWLLGASFISEGAIPFAAADPFRVIPSMMAGGAVTGALIMAFDVTLSAPHGGVFVFFAIGHVAWFFVALAAGVVTGAGCVVLAKHVFAPRRKLAGDERHHHEGDHGRAPIADDAHDQKTIGATA